MTGQREGTGSANASRRMASNGQTEAEPAAAFIGGDVSYITAALSTYSGGPAGDDVAAAWGRILIALHDAVPAARQPIDTAPDLIALLEEGLTSAWCDAVIGCAAGIEPKRAAIFRDHFYDWQHRTRAAIAKATGQSGGEG